MRRPWPAGGCCTKNKQKWYRKHYIVKCYVHGNCARVEPELIDTRKHWRALEQMAWSELK
jgi:succinate dehydrogenase/fumarate reductase-like Fe-S protein